MKNSNKFLLGLFFSFLFLAFLGLYSDFCFGQETAKRYQEPKKIKYNITFNGIPSGYINWIYSGRKFFQGEEVEVLKIEANTDILRLLNLVSSEKVYLDVETNLPVKIERDVELFGEKELIEEKYDQEKGEVTIIKKKGEEVQTKIYEQDAPIHNILELLYFFPQDIKLEERQGEWISFNLPTQEVKIRFHSKREINVSGQRKESYFLEGKGARRFNLWLSQERRLPLRIDFISLMGRIRIRKEEIGKLTINEL